MPDTPIWVQEAAATVDIVRPNILLEPAARNTGPAILAAAGHGAAPMLVAPSDHVIRDLPAFLAAGWGSSGSA